MSNEPPTAETDDSEPSKKPIAVDEIPGPDFTYLFGVEEPPYPPGYDPAQESPGEPGDDGGGSARVRRKCSFAYTAIVEGGGKRTSARVLACRAYKGTAWSLTIRSDVAAQTKPVSDEEQGEDLESEFLERLAKEFKPVAERYLPPADTPEEQVKNIRLKHFFDYCPPGHNSYSRVVGKRLETEPAQTNPRYFNGMFDICNLLHATIFNTADVAATSEETIDEKAVAAKTAEEREPAEGLVVVTGATDSSKSMITRGLIFLLMQDAAMNALAAGTRRPHLLTYEDPIEKYYAFDGAKGENPQDVDTKRSLLGSMNIDYTPRQKGVDVSSLREACQDALRQTPKIFFVGETREARDWAELMRFANTGHLVITTAHANSVVEALGAILRATCADTPSRRSEMCRRIKAVVHIRTLNLGAKRPYVRTLIPSLWLKTSASVNSITADGLASILPSLGGEKILGYYGRTHFADELIKAHKRTTEPGDQVAEDAFDLLRRTASRWDLIGV